MVDDRLAKIFQNLFSVNLSTISPETSAEEIPEWDSLGHLRLILETENVFGVHFTSEEISTLTTVGKLENALKMYGVL